MNGVEIETERLLLRLWEQGDWIELHRTHGAPEVTQWLNIPEPSMDMTAFAVGRFSGQWRSLGFGMWALVEKATGRLVGRTGLHYHRDWPLDDIKVEAGWALEPSVWGRGYATEAARASLAFAFDHLELRRVFSITLPSNERSQAVMRRCGMTLRGEVWFFDRDQVWYAIDRDDWPPPGVDRPRITIREV